MGSIIEQDRLFIVDINATSPKTLTVTFRYQTMTIMMYGWYIKQYNTNSPTQVRVQCFVHINIYRLSRSYSSVR